MPGAFVTEMDSVTEDHKYIQACINHIERSPQAQLDANSKGKGPITKEVADALSELIQVRTPFKSFRA
jgi:hypothetical protein